MNGIIAHHTEDDDGSGMDVDVDVNVNTNTDTDTYMYSICYIVSIVAIGQFDSNDFVIPTTGSEQ